MVDADEFYPVADVSDLPPGQLLKVTVNGRDIVLANVRGAIYGLGAICAHRGGPIAEGRIRSGYVVCPWHAWMYRPADGSVVFPAGEKACLQVYQVKVDGSTVLVSPRRTKTARV